MKVKLDMEGQICKFLKLPSLNGSGIVKVKYTTVKQSRWVFCNNYHIFLLYFYKRISCK